MLYDVRLALRSMARDRPFAGIAVLVLSLGIGINAMAFTLVNAVLFKGLPFPDSGDLYMIGWRTSAPGGTPASYPDLQDLRAGARTFAGIAAFTNDLFNLSDDRALPEQIRGARLTANAFGVLRQPTLLGRDFLPDDEAPGAPPVVILGHSLWTNRYAADPAVLGRTLRLNGAPATIIGVMPPGMQFPINADLWAPVHPTPDQKRQRSLRFLNVFGRLAPDAGRAAADAEMHGLAARLIAEYPQAYEDQRGIAVETFSERFNAGATRTVFLAMLGAVSFVLLIACANVANLQLSRSLRRTREIGVRIALGASRRRIVRLLLIESLLLGLIGGVLGLTVAVVGVRLFDAAVAGTGKPYWIVFSLDYAVFAYLAAICVLTGILFGLAPALHASKTSISGILREGGRGTTGARRARRVSGALVVAEVALAMVLLVAAGLMIRSFLKLYTADVGIETGNLVVMRLQLGADAYSSAGARRRFVEELEAKLAAVPGAGSLALSTGIPGFSAPRRAIEIEGAPVGEPGVRAPAVSVVSVSPGFLDVLEAGVIRGRDFSAHDGSPGSETAIINDRMAAQLFPGEDPIGRRFRFVGPSSAADAAGEGWRTIVGIGPTLRHSAPQESQPRAVAYIPIRQEPDRSFLLLVRSSVDPGVIMNAVRREVQAIDRDQPVLRAQTFDELLANSRWPYRVTGSLFGVFALIGLVLSSVGLYALMAYSVSQRTAEIGIRMALGADARQVAWLFLRRGLLQLAMGLTIGLAGAFMVSGALGALLVQVTPTDPLTFAAIAVLLTSVGLAACLIPARRAARVDPLIALRNDQG